MIGAFARRLLWRMVLRGSGGIEVTGRLPQHPCVVVANHSSHADTAALLAALPARRRPVVAAAADYWFSTWARAILARTVAGVFPVRREGGGCADLLAAATHLQKGNVVIIYPEGTRSRDGSLARFHSGAARLAEHADVPLLPVAIAGTRQLLPVHGRMRRSRVRVHCGTPTTDLHAAYDQVARLRGCHA